MTILFKELAYSNTPIGVVSLRRRRELVLDVDVYEIKLDDDFLMSSLFTVAEEELAHLGLAKLDQPEMDVVVGGLGLGYTAKAALEDSRVKSLIVVEAIGAVIDWHVDDLLPVGTILSDDKRCRMVNGDFFAMAQQDGFDPDQPRRRFDAILLDIDHAPDFNLHDSHSGFYTKDGLTKLEDFLHPGGVFALWSNDPPDDAFVAILKSLIPEVKAHIVSFDNPLQHKQSSNTVYVTRKADKDA
jgi:spermidine synthase